MTNLHNLSLQFGLFYKHNSLPFGRIRAGRRLLLKRAQKGTEIFRPVNHGRKITKSSIGDAKKIAWTRKKEAGKGQKGFLRLFWHKFLYLLTSRIFQPQFNFHLKVHSFHFVSFQSLRRLRQAGAKFCKTLSEVISSYFTLGKLLLIFTVTGAGESPGLVVMGDDSCLRFRWFQSLRCLLDLRIFNIDLM